MYAKRPVINGFSDGKISIGSQDQGSFLASTRHEMSIFVPGTCEQRADSNLTFHQRQKLPAAYFPCLLANAVPYHTHTGIYRNLTAERGRDG